VDAADPGEGTPTPDPAVTALAPGSTTHIPWHSRRAAIVALLGAAALSLAMHLFAGAPLWTAAASLVSVYVCGYVVGALLVARVDDELRISLALIRTTAGLLLTTIGFLLSLVLSVPWFLGPMAVIVVSIGLRRTAAFAWPHIACRWQLDGIAAGLLALTLLSPVWISYVYMAPGPFPPVFYNIDTAYTLEKVHALVAAQSYPPASLSNVGIRRTYHYGSQAMAAFLSRSSGLSPHHSLFLVVLPLLTAAVLAGAAAAARHLSAALPRSVTVPLLLLSTPSLSRSFWHTFGPQLWAAATSGPLSIDHIVGDMRVWGVLSNESMNVGGDFIILGAIAGIAAAPVWGWALPAFLIGSAMLVKTTVGVALVAGFGFAEGWRVLTARRVWPSRQALMAAATFIAIFAAFFVVSFESNFHLELAPLYHLRQVVGSGTVVGSTFDLLWLCFPLLVVLSAGIQDPGRRSTPYLLMAIAPLVVVNVSRLDSTQAGGGGTGDDWLQTLHAVPFLLHAFALSVAARRWPRLGRPRRVAFLVAAVLAIVPVSLAAGRYSSRLIRDPESGTDFVNNRPLAAALAGIPTSGTVIVTNDLRYPAGNFTRDDRQMQIPALFGHQAFAVNYAHEAVEERRGLQQLLQQPQWSDAILDAARTYHWTHLVIRKDYEHADRIPLPQIFANEQYAVFTFP
jgi:preprotein translocase subunit SecE